MTKEILDATRYRRVEGELRFSASMFGNTDLQNFLTIVYGPEEPKEIGQSQIGSVFHKGMENLDVDLAVIVRNEHRMEVENWMETGWKLGATSDRITIIGDSAEIKDYKLTKKYAGKSVKKDLNHAYRLQLNVNRMLFENEQTTPLRMNMVLEMFYKDADPIYHEPSYEQIQVAPIPDIQEQVHAKILALDSLIKMGEMPAECSTKDVWIRKLKNGSTIRSRCAIYCSVAHVCPYYRQESTKQVLSRW